MRSQRHLFKIISCAAILAGLSACGAARANASGVWVEVNPTSIKPGYQVGIRADCGDNSNPATVNSRAFGTVTMQPYNSVLQAEARVPETTATGSYDVTLKCQTGASATTTLFVIKGAKQIGPHTGGGFLAGNQPNPPAGDQAASPADDPAAQPVTTAIRDAADEPANIWLAGSAGAFALAMALSAVALRRRRATGPQ